MTKISTTLPGEPDNPIDPEVRHTAEEIRGYNLRLWDANSTPPGAAMKKATGSFGKFTSTDAYWCIQAATEMFGPMGVAWGYHGPDGGPPLVQWFDGYLTVTLGIWYDMAGLAGPGGRTSKASPIWVTDMIEWQGTRKSGDAFTDLEAIKKCTTQCISKALSLIGIASDVYMGKHEGKYGEDTSDRAHTPARGKPQQAPKEGGRTITQPQQKRLFAIWMTKAEELDINKDIRIQVLKRFLFQDHNVTHSDQIPVSQYDGICEALQNMVPDDAVRYFSGDDGRGPE